MHLPAPWRLIWQGERFAAAINEKTGECRGMIRRQGHESSIDPSPWRWLREGEEGHWQAVAVGLMRQQAGVEEKRPALGLVS